MDSHPLKTPTAAELQRLCQALWGWEACANCQAQRPCHPPRCPWQQHSPRLGNFFTYYREVTFSYIPNLLGTSTPALTGHEDICSIIRTLQTRPSASRSDITTECFPTPGKAATLSKDDQHRAINLAVKVMFMVTCTSGTRSPGLLELGAGPTQWQDDVSLTQLFTAMFPTTDHPLLNDLSGADGSASTVRGSLTASRLKKTARLKFRGTDDLRHHLRLDTKTGVVEIYHFTSVLKQHLATSNSDPGGSATLYAHLFSEAAKY
jgi:hypothetical protein